VQTESIGKLGHRYATESIVWSWTGYEAATASFACTADATHVITMNATISSETVAPTIEEDGYTAYTATVTLGEKAYSDVKKAPGDNLKSVWDSAIDALIHTNNGTLYELYVDYRADGTESGRFSHNFELAGNLFKDTFVKNKCTEEYYTYENGILIVYDYVDGRWERKPCDYTGYVVSAFSEGFGKQELLQVVREFYSQLSYDARTGEFSIDEVVILGETYVDSSMIIKDGVITEMKSTRVNADGSKRSMHFTFSNYGTTALVLPEAIS
jgi:hypothetical protein